MPNLGITGCVTTACLLELSYCCRLLRWELLWQQFQDAWFPDFIFNEPGFQPILPHRAKSSVVAEHLRSYDTTSESQLHLLVDALLHSYAEYQRSRVAAAAKLDARLQFEMDTMAGPDLQVMLTQDPGSPISMASFVVPIPDLQLTSLLPFLAAESQESLPQAITKLERQLLLRVAYAVGVDDPADTPEVALSFPRCIEDIVGKPAPLRWEAGMCMAEYVPLMAATCQQHLDTAAHGLLQRRAFLQACSEALSPPAHQDMLAWRSAAFKMQQEEVSYTLLVHLHPSFPHEKPRLTLQGLDNEEPVAVFTEYPWNSEWSAQRQAQAIADYMHSKTATLDHMLTVTP